MSKRIQFAVLLFLALGLLAYAGTASAADDTAAAPAAAPAASEQQGQPSSGQIPVGSTGEEFKIPENATPAQLADFAKNLIRSQRKFENEEEYKNWLNQMFQTVLEVTNRILSGESDDKTFLEACGMKGQILARMAAGNKEYLGTFDQFVTALEGAERVQKDENGREMTLSFRSLVYQDRVANIVQAQGSLDELRGVFKEIQAFILKNPAASDMVFDLIYPISVFSESNQKPELNGQLLQEFYDALKDSKEEIHQEVVKGLEGSLRFAALRGQPMQLAGVMPDEKPFDPAILQGKVVIVDFWATWCMPCLAIQPELQTLYEKYKDQGLEIIGYNIDTELDMFKKFYAEKKLPWPVIVEKLSVKENQQPLSEYYGITGIPTLILIGRDGKVISQDLDIDGIKENVELLFKK